MKIYIYLLYKLKKKNGKLVCNTFFNEIIINKKISPQARTPKLYVKYQPSKLFIYIHH